MTLMMTRKVWDGGDHLWLFCHTCVDRWCRWWEYVGENNYDVKCSMMTKKWQFEQTVAKPRVEMGKICFADPRLDLRLHTLSPWWKRWRWWWKRWWWPFDADNNEEWSWKEKVYLRFNKNQNIELWVKIQHLQIELNLYFGFVLFNCFGHCIVSLSSPYLMYEVNFFFSNWSEIISIPYHWPYHWPDIIYNPYRAAKVKHGPSKICSGSISSTSKIKS